MTLKCTHKMGKKLYLIMLVAILGISLVSAGIVSLSAFSKDATVDSKTKTTLDTIGITDPVYKATYCTEDVCEYCGRDTITSTCLNEETNQMEACEISYGTGCVKVPNRECTSWSDNQEDAICQSYRLLTEEEKKVTQAKLVEETLTKIAEVYDKRTTTNTEALGDATYNIKAKLIMLPK